MKRITLLVALLIPLNLAAATQRYVTDVFDVTLRTGHSGEHSIIQLLTSGTPLEVLETNPESGYSRVRTGDNKEGWVITRFLMVEPSAREQLESSREKLGALELEHRRLMTEINKLREAAKSVAAEQSTQEDKSRELQLQLTEIRRTAANAIAIEDERKSLQSRALQMERELQALQIENDSLKDRTARDWFMVGAGVLLFGILTGIVISRMRVRRRSDWGSL